MTTNYKIIRGKTVVIDMEKSYIVATLNPDKDPDVDWDGSLSKKTRELIERAIKDGTVDLEITEY